jgi:hypothetical protein
VQGQGVLAYSDKVAAFVAEPLLPAEDVVGRLRALWQQEEAKSFAATDGYTRLKALKDKDVRFFLSGSVLPSVIVETAPVSLPFPHSFTEIDVVGSLSVTAKEIAFAAEYYSNNEELQDFLNRRTLDVHALSGALFQYVPADAFLCLATKADMVSTLIDKQPILKAGIALLSMQTKMPLNDLLHALEGDQVLGVLPPPTGKPFTMAPFLYAECRPETMNKLLANQTSLSIPNWGTSQIGVKGSVFYYRPHHTPFAPEKVPLDHAGYAADHKGELLAYLFARPAPFLAAISQDGGEEDAFSVLQPWLNEIQSLELAFLTDRRIALNIYRTPHK